MSEMPVDHLCGLDEIFQLKDRRPAAAHFEDVLRWVLEPSSEPGTMLMRGISAAMGFAFGLAGLNYESTWSSTQAEWGAAKVASSVFAVFSDTAVRIAIWAGSAYAGHEGAPALGVSAGAFTIAAGEASERSRDAMARLYPLVVTEWSIECWWSLGTMIYSYCTRASMAGAESPSRA